jgi:hypothetical protein
MTKEPRLLETACEWRSADVADESAWIVRFTDAEIAELDAALRHALSVSDDLLDIDREAFPLPVLSARLAEVERELISGRGFALLRGIPRSQYSQAEMETLYWGIGMHLGLPWPQNKKGHMLGDVLDQGKTGAEADSRGNEIGGATPFPYHSDGSDLVGLMCLSKAASGGLSTVANAVAIHNDLVRESPHLAAALYESLPYDFRGEQPEGGRAWYTMPAFTEHGDRLFVRYIRPYILFSQRHADAPRITEVQEEAMQRVDAMTRDPDYNVFMDFEPGDMQFVNNYHVLHARTTYVDDRSTGQIRHLTRLWLETRVLEDRPALFRNNVGSHWARKPTLSRIEAS